MSDSPIDRSIDFDQVADLYDSYVQVDFDIEFWKQETHTTNGKVLELMCGTGRIGLPLIDAGVSYTGLDYCRNQITQFEYKLASGDRQARLIFADARRFDLDESYDLVFIGFSSLSEVVDNQDKIKVLERVRAHLKPDGHITFSLHNPSVRWWVTHLGVHCPFQTAVAHWDRDRNAALPDQRSCRQHAR